MAIASRIGDQALAVGHQGLGFGRRQQGGRNVRAGHAGADAEREFAVAGFAAQVARGEIARPQPRAVGRPVAGLRQAAAVGAMAAAAVLSVEAFPFAQRFRGEFDRRADGDRRARLQLALRLFGGLLDGQRPTGAHRGRVDRLGAPVDRQSPHLAGQREQVGIGQPTPRPS